MTTIRSKIELANSSRKILSEAKRVVIKVGTHILVDKNGRLQRRRIAGLVEQINQLQCAGIEVVLVSSGAIGAGVNVLKMKKRPTDLVDLQMAAAVGQTELLNCYNDYFRRKRCHISQVLLTHADLKHRERHLNARNTMLNLLRNGIVPIVNENDVVAVDEIKVGDNDVLSALVTVLLDADALLLLTTVDGVRAARATRTQRIPYIERVNASVLSHVIPKRQSLSVGGMATKLQAAQIAAKVGALVVIANGIKPSVIADILAGKDCGTLIGNKNTASHAQKRKHWISFFHRSQGQLIIDDGAKFALQKKGKSLLPIGVKEIDGEFNIGSHVEIIDKKGELVAVGLVEYNSEQINKIKGHKSTDITKILGTKYHDVVVHRNNMVLA